MKIARLNASNLIPLASIPILVGVFSLIGLSIEIFLLIGLASIATTYFLTQRKQSIASDNDSVQRLELETIPEKSALKTIDLKAYYFGLYKVLMSINPDQYTQNNPQIGPFVFHRLSVTDNGLLQISPVREAKPIQYTPQEAKKIAIAIYQMAFACTLYAKQEVSLLIDRGIGHFIMKPFKALHPTPAVLHIGYHYNRLSYFYARNNSNKYKATHPLRPESAAQIIQRAYRKRLFKQHPPAIQECSLELKRTMQEQRITETPTLHTRFLPLSTEKKNKWLAGVSESDQELAKKMLTHVISYKSAAQFRKQLHYVITQFNQFIHSLSADQRDFVLVIPNIGETRLASNHWVTALAIPMLVKKPRAIVGNHDIERYASAHPEIKYYVFIDDAVYSGRQLCGYISKVEQLKLSPVLILPFYTRWNQVTYVAHQFRGEVMLKPRELIGGQWTKDDNEQFAYFANGQWTNADNKVGTFFFHKLPDNASSFLSIYNKRMQALIEPETNGLRNY